MPEKKYYSAEEASQCLGVTPVEVNHLRENHELHGYRDGASWKYKVEDVDAMAKERRLKQKLSTAEPGEETGDVLLSELALGGSDAGSSGTVIGGGEKRPHDSDLRLADSDVKIGAPLSSTGSGKGSSKSSGRGSGKGSGKGKATPPPNSVEIVSEPDVALVEGISLDEGMTTLDEGVSLDEPKPATARRPLGDSAVDLDSAQKKSDEDNVVLGGSGVGSDITIGGDSGISLVDPADSGLSLEEPLELERTDEDSLELGEDDMLTFAEDADTDAPTQLRTDEDFMLTPPEEAPEEESDSGSQVIALDTEQRPGDSAPTVMAAGPSPTPAAMLDEEFATPADVGLAAAPAVAALGASPASFPEVGVGAVPAQMGEMAAPEAPYSGLNIAALAACTLLLVVGGMIAYDLVRNMWSWNEPYTVSSKLMDLIVSHK